NFLIWVGVFTQRLRVHAGHMLQPHHFPVHGDVAQPLNTRGPVFGIAREILVDPTSTDCRNGRWAAGLVAIARWIRSGCHFSTSSGLAPVTAASIRTMSFSSARMSASISLSGRGGLYR